MDINTLAQLLKQTLDPAAREAAEAELSKVQKIIGFCPSLLTIIIDNNIEGPVRQAGVIYFKNMVLQSWADKEYDASKMTEIPFSIHEQDRATIRENIVAAVVHSSEMLRIQLCICVSIIAKHDFPGRWFGAVDKFKVFLEGQEPQNWLGALMALYQLVKNYEYRKSEDRKPIYEALVNLFPDVFSIFTKCVNETGSKDAADVRKIILKIFFALNQFVFSRELLNNEDFTKWMELINRVLLAPVPSEADAVDIEERPQLVWWKEKKWAIHIMARIFDRYGSPGNTLTSEGEEFAEWYLKTFSQGIITTLLKVLEAYKNKVYVSPRVIQLSLNYLNTAVSHSMTWRLIKPNAMHLIREVVFPIMSYTEEDNELWESDPYEYIRSKFDIFEDFVSPVTAAQTLLHSMCKKRKGILPETMDFLLSVLQIAETPASAKDGALHMVGSLATLLLKKKTYKDRLEEFLIRFVFPEFQSPFGHLRARACWMLHNFSDVKFKQSSVLGEALRLAIGSMLQDTQVPVKVEAAIALQMILTSQEEAAKPFVEPFIQDITMQLLQIIRDTNNDDLTSVMQKIVCTYTEQITPLATNICSHIVGTFCQVVEKKDDSDEATITAMGLLSTLETILSVMEDRPEIHALMEPIVLQAVRYVFTNSIMEFYEETLSLCSDLTSVKVSPEMWMVLADVYTVFDRDALDYFNDMMPLLYNYVTVDTPAFMSNPSHLVTLFNMSKKMLESDPGEDPECHAAKLLEIIILQCKDQNINQVIPSFVDVVLKRLFDEQNKIKTSELKTMCLQVLIAALLYNTELLIAHLRQYNVNGRHDFVQRFIKSWLDETDCFIGIHDRKLSILGFCRLVEMAAVIPEVAQFSNQIMPCLLMLFDGLKRAYENQNLSDAESSEAEDSDDNDGLESDEDEIDEESRVYLESLQGKIKKNAPTDMKIDATIQQDDSDEDDDDDDDIYETSFDAFTTPLDGDESGVDEYDIFVSLLGRLESSSVEWYACLVSQLNEPQKQALGEVVTLCQQRRAMKQSQSIERAGGYSFQASQNVPATFAFSNGGGPNFQFGK